MISYLLYLIDDEETVRESLTMALEGEYTIRTFAGGVAAVQGIHDASPDLVLLDIGLPDMSGIEVLRQIKSFDPNIVVVMITAYEDAQTVISAMKCGAYDYVVKPIDIDSLKITIENGLETIRLKKEVQSLQEKYLEEHLPCFIGESNVIQDVVQFIGMVAQSPDTPILILGETGTGKDLIASAIHYRSPNFRGPLIAVNCAAIPRDLIESELFGYEKGAFSGASEAGKKGLVEEASEGTLFLDEVGDLSTAAQAKLLRFLEEGTFYRIGGTKKIHIQTRVVSATNKNLATMIEGEQFRKDLYFRLGVVKVTIPSLNERAEDIVPLAKHFLYGFSKKFNKSFTGITPEAESALKRHRWVGNIRELKNLIERAVLTGTGPVLGVKDLGQEVDGGSLSEHHRVLGLNFPPVTGAGVDFLSIQKSLEKYYLEEALRVAGGNESKAAELLNMNRHTFRYRRKELNIK